MHSWIRGVALLIYGGQHHIEHDSPLEHGHPTTSDPSTILLREYQLVLKVPIGTAPSKIHIPEGGIPSWALELSRANPFEMFLRDSRVCPPKTAALILSWVPGGSRLFLAAP